MNVPIFIIAEAGVNHNGDMSIACRLVVSAAEAGADAIKFQTFRADKIASRDAQQAEYQKKNIGKVSSQHAMLKPLELSADDHDMLIECCRKNKIEFLSTAFDDDSIDLLKKLNLSRWKIPSGEITNLPYLRKIGAIGRQIILSTGMAYLEEVEKSVQILLASGRSRDEITLLHCTSEYPTPFTAVNLNAMITMQKVFGMKVGYSDHTEGIEVSLAAVALGATIVEKHLTIDRTLPGPDHTASIEPEEFAKMVSSIRNIEKAMGSGIKQPTIGELENRKVARKSIVAMRPIKSGDILTEENITVKRPGTGISPMEWDRVCGRIAVKDYHIDEQIWSIEGYEE